VNGSPFRKAVRRADKVTTLLDLVKLLPSIVQAIGALLGVLYALSVFVNAVARSIPSAWIIATEARAPRVAWFARAVRKLGGDAIPALKALYAALAGKSYEPGGWSTHPGADDYHDGGAK
jgi:hypothetical protein